MLLFIEHVDIHWRISSPSPRIMHMLASKFCPHTKTLNLSLFTTYPACSSQASDCAQFQVEYALNDGYREGSFDSPIRRSFERLLRRLLVFPQHPAIILLMFTRLEPWWVLYQPLNSLTTISSIQERIMLCALLFYRPSTLWRYMSVLSVSYKFLLLTSQIRDCVTSRWVPQAVRTVPAGGLAWNFTDSPQCSRDGADVASVRRQARAQNDTTPQFLTSGEDQMAPMAQYYDLPWLSWRALVWEKLKRKKPGWTTADLMAADKRHPNDRGHTCVCRPPAWLQIPTWVRRGVQGQSFIQAG